jgi:hypothetical protein
VAVFIYTAAARLPRSFGIARARSVQTATDSETASIPLRRVADQLQRCVIFLMHCDDPLGLVRRRQLGQARMRNVPVNLKQFADAAAEGFQRSRRAGATSDLLPDCGNDSGIPLRFFLCVGPKSSNLSFSQQGDVHAGAAGSSLRSS